MRVMRELSLARLSRAHGKELVLANTAVRTGYAPVNGLDLY
jgi:hypothetical protein